MAEHAAKLVAKQQQLQRMLERSLENFKKLGKSNLTPARIRSRISSLKETWSQFLNGHADLMKAISEANQQALSYFNENHFEATEEIFQTTLDHMSECLEELEPPVSPNQTLDTSNSRPETSAFSLTHLPPIRLPMFDGNYDEWEHFRDRFTALIINNKELKNFARMHFLTSCLKGQALECVKDIPVTADNFNIAWQTVNSRFENKRRLLGVHLSSILNVPNINRESAADLRNLLDKVTVAIASLRNLKRNPEDLWNDMLVHIIAQKLDPVTRKAWTVKSTDCATPPSFADISQFLTSRTRALEEFSMGSNKMPAKPASITRVHAATASTPMYSPSLCVLCKAKHYFSACPTFVRGSPLQRRELVKQHNRCSNCLSKNHSARYCPSKYSCRLCQQKHHTMLHASSDAKTDHTAALSSASESREAGEPHPKAHSLLASSNPRARAKVLLATAWITLGGPSGHTVTVRALLDQGSEITFVSEEMTQLLKTKRVRMPVSISAVGCVNAGTFHYATQIVVSPRESSSPSVSTQAVILKHLTTYTPKHVANMSALDHLRDLPWADPDPTSADPIHVIIGADLYSDIMLDGVRKGTLGQPMAQRSIFGWIISGPIKSDLLQSNLPMIDSPSTRSITNITAHHCANGASLEDSITKFWEIEEVPRKSILSVEDEKCDQHFRETHSRASDGRYIVRLPFKKGPPIDIGESRFRAQRLLNSLQNRFRSHSTLAEKYYEFLDEYEHLGHMRQAPIFSNLSGQQVFLSHHPVIRSDSATTSLRVVFNASCLTSNGSSLNHHLLAGPKLQSELATVILRWRKFKFVYTADIAKMYRQILVDHRDINYQSILWQPVSTNIPITYQLLTLTYGMVCAPYIALRVLKQLVSDNGSKFPLACPIVTDHMYVDDVLFGGDNAKILLQMRDQLIKLLRCGGFELRKWASNSSTLLSDIDPANHGLACTKAFSINEGIKVLGIGWNPAHDTFQLNVALVEKPPESKRSILGAIAKLFDPLGWVTPVIITAKIFMQQLWRRKLQWDEIIPEDLCNHWEKIYSQLSYLNGLSIPRWTGLGEDTLRAELHGFADASNVAYSAVVYLKVISNSGEVTITLLAGKSRVAPLTPVSIPRLELSAALLLARLLRFLRETLDSTTLECFCWTDSMVVLAWLAQHPSRWKTFVANRVAEVQALSPNIPWRHVPTGDNPADCASRGLLGKEFLTHSLWWHGPEWLLRPPEEWPTARSNTLTDTSIEERAVTLTNAQPLVLWDLASKYSSWTKLIRVTAYILRFVSLCRRNKGLHPSESSGIALTATECDSAQVLWIKNIQASDFPDEIHSLTQTRSLSSKSSILTLHPFLDQNGILRVGGRLKKAPFPFERQHPILLASHPLVQSIISKEHLRLLHSGIQLTLASLRRTYWIIRARAIVKTVIHRCVTCARERSAIPSQLMGDLPEVRVTKSTRSFVHCGVDYAGPMHVRASAGRGITSRKAYIALFICLATRAIHLELVSDYSTAAFLNAFTRFCSRRGFPKSMYSDNGTTFVGADRELTSAYRAAIRDPTFQNRTANDNISWQFIPPSAPHFGGLWESGVRSVKHHLRRVLGSNTLTFEEFSTLLCKIEACLNSRPIAPLSDTLEDYEALTPGHFLIGSAITTHPDGSVLDVKENRLTRWQLVRHITERFWKLWYDDYINTLQQRSKWRKLQPSIKIGQMVLVRNSTLPPCKWELGRVTCCHPGADGLTRVVTIKTAHSEYKRPIVKLCILPIDCENSDAN